ncbi:MAG: hypothetical protein OXI39_12575 [Gemmatimonadota bacterium]|uniref:hypothetical protein n=1 Tax=Candidatus Palauibacter scopulicola TaxID=3056741 RepID=UPI0023A70F48|nr:hypothetical protein [Candidatus Palauibacter scopulicola]MDE2663823.1 hypothetical protein [Candidatus Palauibacter scopulicola]
MNQRIAFPFLTLSEAAVMADPWTFSLSDTNWMTLGHFLPDLDSASKLRIRRNVTLDPLQVADDLSIPLESLRLAVGVRVGTGPGRLPRLIVWREHRELAEETWETEFEIGLSGHQLSLVLDIQTEVSLAKAPENPGPLSPRLPASRLWSDSVRALIEGEEPRFPMEVANFRDLLGNGAAAAAPWYLHWSPRDWNRDFQGAARLYINSDQSDFISRIEDQDAPTLQLLLAEIMGQICERLVSDPEANEIISEAARGSLGAQAAAWLNGIWPKKDASFMRSLLEQRPGLFRAAVLELAELREV